MKKYKIGYTTGVYDRNYREMPKKFSTLLTN